MSDVAEMSVSTVPKNLAPPNVVLLRTRGPELSNLTEVRKEMSKVYRLTRKGQINSQEGARYIYMLSQIGKTVEMIDNDQRIEALERALGRRLK
jgi:hypothetical protein